MSPRRLIAPEEHRPRLQDQVADLPMFAIAEARDWLLDLSPRVIAIWSEWRLSEVGQRAIAAATDIALERVRGGESRLFIDELAWEIRRRTGVDLNNTVRAPLARYLMATYEQLRGRFEVRGPQKKAG